MRAEVITIALVLLVAANAAPILARNLCGDRGARPIDGGYRWFDGRPVLGAAKTWRGVIAALLATAVLAWLLALPVCLGAAVAAAAMLGDALSSFLKRRLRQEVSDSVLGLDQLPEAVLPLWVLAWAWSMSLAEFMVSAVAFVAFELLVSPVLFRLRVRRRPR